MWNLFMLKKWRAACRCSSVIWNKRCSPREELLAAFYSSGDLCSSQQLTKPLRTKDIGFKPTGLLKCHYFTFSWNLSRTSGFPFTKRPQRKEPTAAHPGSRVPSDLQRLSLEDFTETEAQHLHKGTQKVKACLKGRKEREDRVFGVAPCLLALSQGKRKPRCLFVKSTEGRQREAAQKVCEEALRRGVPIQQICKRDLDKMTGGMVHQGLCLQASPLNFITEEESTTSQPGGHPHPLWLVLDGVQDPMNLGTIMRSAYFLGVDRVASSIRNRYFYLLLPKQNVITLLYTKIKLWQCLSTKNIKNVKSLHIIR